MDTLAERARAARMRTDYSPSELAGKAGIGRAAISKIESGKTKSMELKTAVAYQRLCGVSVEWLLTGKGPMLNLQVKDENLARLVSKLDSLPPGALEKIESDIDYIASLQSPDQSGAQ